MQQIFLGLGAVATKTYVDDVFSTYLYKGNGSARSINNGVNLSVKGGMTWIKNRSGASNHALFDTVRGATKEIQSDYAAAETTQSAGLTAFNSNGFSLGADQGNRHNQNGSDFASWTFRKSPGFCDVVTYTGNGSNRTIAHSLGSVPGMILIKNLDATENWRVYHRFTKATHFLGLNQNNATQTSTTPFNDTEPTSSVFSVGTDTGVNQNGSNIIAYLFAGGESTAATARSVDFDGNDYLLAASSSDFTLTGDFTMECWFKSDNVSGVHVILNGRGSASSGGPVIYTNGTSLVFDNGAGAVATASSAVTIGQWYHVAGTRSGNNWKLYLNGGQVASGTDSSSYSSSVGFMIGQSHHGNEGFDGQISNARVTKGQVLYTSSFRPSTEPLTQTSQGATSSNVELLCCNNSSVTGSTVTAGTISATGDPTASTDSPFDDPAGFKFGDAGDQNVIKCGSYVGNGSTDGPEINLGFEPQWVMVKDTSTGHWFMGNNMQGVVTGGNDPYVTANNNNAEYASYDWIEFTPTGFNLTNTSANINANGNTYIYMSIRRPDGYVGKPPELGTSVFAMDTGSGSSTIPNFDSGFPVDWAITRAPASATNWETGGRLIQGKWLETNNTAAESPGAYFTFDSNTGWMSGATAYNSSYQAWMWKRHAGFDVVTNLKEFNSHNLGKIPEMVWIKRRDNTSDWFVWHKGLNGGTNDGLGYNLRLNTGDPENSTPSLCPIGDQLPTATHFKTASDSDIRNAGSIACLFASVDGISKVGYYTGTGSSGHSITTGFQPRFIVIKPAHRPDTYGGSWHMFDTLRGINSGAEYPLRLDTNEPQTASNHLDYIDLDSDGFTIISTHQNYNFLNARYIYYAHA